MLAFGLVTTALSAGQEPSRHIELSDAGYKELSSMARRSDKVNLTIDFIDHDRILVTFNPKRLFKRLPECPPSHDDHLTDAAVLDVETGRILASTTWYLHDGRPYLWPLGAGKFLLRRLNSLYTIDAQLREKLLFTSPAELLWVTVTPDGKQVIDEVAQADGAAKAKVRVEFRDAQGLAVQRTIFLEKPAPMEASSSGFASVIPGFSGRVWLVRFGPSEQQRDNIARVRTRRVPDILYLSNNTLLIGRDSAREAGYSVSAFTVTGTRLWRQHWEAHRYSPMVERSEDGSRFAISTMHVDEARLLGGASTPSAEGVLQNIQVFNTASGEPLLSVPASPVFVSGRNFALSPDGRRLAVLHGSRLDFYTLPAMSPEEYARYTAVKADVPGLFVAPTVAAENNPDENTFAVADENGMPPERAQPAQSDPVSVQGNTGAAPAANLPSATQGGVPPKAADKVLTLRSTRRIVALDVVVTDANGHPVQGLSEQDFQVKEDGRPQSINYFMPVSAGAEKPEPKPATAKPANSPPNLFTNASAEQMPSAITVILYDVLNTPASDQQRARLELVNFIQHKPKDARFALCTLSNGLRMIQGFTPDEDLLARAVKNSKSSLRYTSMLGQDASDQMLVSWLEQGAQNAAGLFGPKSGVAASALLGQAGRLEEQMADRRARDVELRMALTMDAFTQLARYLAALPGRKSIIWLSGSFPLGIFPGMDFRNLYAENATRAEEMKQAVNLLAESHVAVYPVDVRGLTASSMASPNLLAGLDLTQPAAPVAPLAPNGQASNTQRFDELSNLNSAGAFSDEMTEHGLMTQIASDTGGKAFYNANGIEQAMSIALQEETNYYALSYSPSNKKYDGKYRRIKVGLQGNHRHLHVIHRSGYFGVDPDAPNAGSRDAATGFGLAAMEHDAPQAKQLLFEVRVVPLGKPRMALDPRASRLPVKKKKKNKHAQNSAAAAPIAMQLYQIDYAITPSQLHFDEKPDGVEHAAMNFMATSFAPDGSMWTSIGSHMQRDLDSEAYQDAMAGGFRLHQELELPIAAASLRLGVQDAITGRMGTLEIPLPVKAPPGVEQSRTRRMPEIEPD